MDEIWERAVETALDGKTDRLLVRTLTLDGAVKCVQGRMPSPGLLEKFQNLQHLSVANIGVSSLEQFPRLRNLQKLILSDNRIAGGLEFLVEGGLDSLRDLDLSNNRIQNIEDLAPLAQLKLISLDLYECPVTRIKDYRSRVFGLIKSLKYLDKIDAEGIEKLDSDDEEDEEDEEYDVDEEDGAEDEEDGYLVEDGDEEGVDNDAGDLGGPKSNGRLMNMEEEIDGLEQGEDDEDGDGETGEAEQEVEDGVEFEDEEGDEEDEDYGDGYLVQPVGQVEVPQDMDPFDEEDDGQEEEEVDDEDDGVQVIPSTSLSHLKRKRDGENDGVDDEEDDDVVQPSNSTKKRS